MPPRIPPLPRIPGPFFPPSPFSSPFLSSDFGSADLASSVVDLLSATAVSSDFFSPDAAGALPPAGWPNGADQAVSPVSAFTQNKAFKFEMPYSQPSRKTGVLYISE